ncbi:hypothetical protein JCM8115_003114 [Rhodotorula mucilaginosa]
MRRPVSVKPSSCRSTSPEGRAAPAAFWLEGRCKFGTSCKHCHDRTKDDEASVNRQRQAPQPPAPKKLTDQELTAIASGGGSDAVAGQLMHLLRGHLYRYLARDGSGRFLQRLNFEDFIIAGEIFHQKASEPEVLPEPERRPIEQTAPFARPL